MRLASSFCLLFTLMGISAAQDMSFSAGPQYLMTSGDPAFARSIATPTLSLDTPLPPIPSLPEVGPVVVDQPYIPIPALEQLGPDLFPIHYGYPMPSVVESFTNEPPRELPPSLAGYSFKLLLPHAYIALVALIVVTVIFEIIRRGAMGYRLRAIKENTPRAAMLGHSVPAYELAVFVLAVVWFVRSRWRNRMRPVDKGP